MSSDGASSGVASRSSDADTQGKRDGKKRAGGFATSSSDVGADVSDDGAGEVPTEPEAQGLLKPLAPPREYTLPDEFDGDQAGSRHEAVIHNLVFESPHGSFLLTACNPTTFATLVMRVPPAPKKPAAVAATATAFALVPGAHASPWYSTVVAGDAVLVSRAESGKKKFPGLLQFNSADLTPVAKPHDLTTAIKRDQDSEAADLQLVVGGEYLIVHDGFNASPSEDSDGDAVNQALTVWVGHKDLPGRQHVKYNVYDIGGSHWDKNGLAGVFVGAATRRGSGEHEFFMLETTSSRRGRKLYGFRLPAEHYASRDAFVKHVETTKRPAAQIQHGEVAHKLPAGVWHHTTLQSGHKTGIMLLTCAWAPHPQDSAGAVSQPGVIRLFRITDMDMDPQHLATFDVRSLLPREYALVHIDGLAWGAPGVLHVAYTTTCLERPEISRYILSLSYVPNKKRGGGCCGL